LIQRAFVNNCPERLARKWLFPGRSFFPEARPRTESVKTCKDQDLSHNIVTEIFQSPQTVCTSSFVDEVSANLLKRSFAEISARSIRAAGI
jgi:hypothetical protein